MQIFLQLPSLELQRVLRDLSQFGDTITILAAKDSVTFRLVRQQQQQPLSLHCTLLFNSADGSLGSGNIKLSQTATKVNNIVEIFRCYLDI